MGAAVLVEFCTVALLPMRVSRCGTLPSQTIAKYRRIRGLPAKGMSKRESHRVEAATVMWA